MRALLTGVLHDNPQVRTSKSGKLFTTAKLLANGTDNTTIFVSLTAFNELAERLDALSAGQAVSITGRAKLTAWIDKAGVPKAGLDVVIDDLITLKAKPRSHEASG